VRDCVFDSSVRFFTKVAKTVLLATGDAAISRDRVRDLWQHVTFSNYAPTVFRSDRQRPSPEDWQLGREALGEQVAEYRPEVIIVLGLELASHLDWLPAVALDVAVVAIAHPSSFGFKYDRWVPAVAGGPWPRRPTRALVVTSDSEVAAPRGSAVRSVFRFRPCRSNRQLAGVAQDSGQSASGLARCLFPGHLGSGRGGFLVALSQRCEVVVAGTAARPSC
jgi:hypothetical protein